MKTQRRAGSSAPLFFRRSAEHPLGSLTEYLDCVRKRTPIRNEEKAKVWAYLAGRGEFDPQVGRAAEKKVWNWASPALKKLSDFLYSL